MLCAWSCSVPVVNVRIYRLTGVGGIVWASIVELRSSFAARKVDASSGELFTKTRSKISNRDGVVCLSSSGVGSQTMALFVDWMGRVQHHAMQMRCFVHCIYLYELEYTPLCIRFFCIRISWALLRWASAAVNRFLQWAKKRNVEWLEQMRRMRWEDKEEDAIL